jgi:hypothetical protein
MKIRRQAPGAGCRVPLGRGAARRVDCLVVIEDKAPGGR